MRTVRLTGKPHLIKPLPGPERPGNATAMDGNTMVARSAELIETEVDGELVALDVARGTCLGFNATASRVWALIERPATLSDLLARLGEEFDVEPARCADDVEALLAQFSEGGLIRLDPPPAAG